MPWQFPRLPRLMTGWFGTAGGAGRASRLAPPAAAMGGPRGRPLAQAAMGATASASGSEER